MMSRKNEIIKAGVLTALVAFVVMSAFAVFAVAPEGQIAISAYAFRSQEPPGGNDSGEGHDPAQGEYHSGPSF